MRAQNSVKAIGLAVVGSVVLCAIAAQAFTTQLQGWQSSVTVATGTAGVHHKMVVDEATDTVHMVYSSGGNVYHQSMARPSGAMSPATLISANASSPAIALDSAGNLHVALYDTANTDLAYATSSTGGASWSTAALDVSAEDRGQGTCILVDLNDRIHIGYRGQNGTTDGTITGKGNPGTPFHDLWYARFNGDATAGGTTVPANWDTPQVLVAPFRAIDGRSFIEIGSDITNLDIESDGSNVWLWRREGDNSATASEGYFFRRPLGAAAGSVFTNSSSTSHGMAQIALDSAGEPYRAWWDRNNWTGGGTSGFYLTHYDGVGTAGTVVPIDDGLHADGYWSVGKHPDIVIDLNDAFLTAYYDGDTPDLGVKFAFSLDGAAWNTEFVPGGGLYSGDNRLALDSQVAGGLGEVYLLSSSGGTLTLFVRDAKFVPEPSVALLLGLGTAALAGCRRARRG